MSQPTEWTRRASAVVITGVTALGAGIGGAGIGGATASAATANSVSGSAMAVSAAANQSVGTITISEGAAGAIPANSFVCITAGIGSTTLPFATANPSTGTFEVPTVTASGGATVSNANLVTATSGATVTPSGSATATGFAFQVTKASTSPASYVISGLHANTSGLAGQVTVTATEAPSASAACTGATSSTGQAPVAHGVAFGIGQSAASAIYGQDAAATTAAEFERAFTGCAEGTSANVKPVVLATDAAPYDALSAAALEAQLHTGILITDPSSLSPEARQAIQSEGVTTVYVVGGPDAVSPAVQSAITALNVNDCAGETASGHLSIAGPFYGQTADNTAAAIANEIVSLGGSAPTLNLSSVTNANAYNADTASTASQAGTNAKTAILAIDNHFQDSMSASGLSYFAGVPVILTPGGSSTIGSAAAQEISALGVKQLIVLGGHLAIPDSVLTGLQSSGLTTVRVAGLDGTQTAVEVAALETSSVFSWDSTGTVANGQQRSVILTQGAQGFDGLGAAPLSAGENPTGVPEPIMLTESPSAGLGPYTPSGLSDLGALPNPYLQIQPLGGPLALPSSQVTAAVNALAS